MDECGSADVEGRLVARGVSTAAGHEARARLGDLAYRRTFDSSSAATEHNEARTAMGVLELDLGEAAA